MNYLTSPFFVSIVAGVIVFFGLLAVLIFRKKGPSSLHMKLLSIRLPKVEEKKEGGFIAEIGVSEQLFAALLGLKIPFAFEVAVEHTNQEIKFFVGVPRRSLDFAARQIHAFFPDAKVEEVPDYTIFGQNSFTRVAHLALSVSDILPIRTYKEANADTFAPLISTLSRMKELGEGAAIQIIAEPASGSIKSQVLSAISGLKKGKKMSEFIKSGGLAAALGDTLKELAPQTEKSSDGPKPVDEEAVKILQSKIEKPLVSVNVRIVTAAETSDRAEDLLLSLGSAFGQFTAPLRNSLKLVKPKNTKPLISQYIFRDVDQKTAFVLNTEELTSIFHLPVSSTEVPRIAWLKYREAPPPQNIPSEGVILGESVFHGDQKDIRLADDDRRRHLYIIGQTGTGKSYLALSMAIQDMQNGKGFCFIDPHGDVVEDILAHVPQDRVKDVIVFDPGDIKRPLGLNMLDFNPNNPEEKTFIVNEIQAIFNRLFSAETMGPMFEQYMRNTLLLLMEDAVNEPATLVEVPRVLTDEAFRKRKLARIKNPVVVDFWEKEAAKTTGEQGLANMAPYITSKFGNFIANDYIRPIIGQTKSSFNFREVMDSGKILLVNMSKGKIGDINAGLLGMIITGRLLMAALSRQDIADKEERRDFNFYIDEFQNFTTDSIAVILSEARKYRLNLVLAHQFIGQLTDEIRKAVFGNVGSIISFRVGVPDQETLIKSFGPEFSERDLLTIENRSVIAKLLLGGEPARPFNFRTYPVSRGNPEVRTKLKELSRLTYGAEVEKVEEDILARLRN